MNRHECFMRKALRLAEKGRGQTSPNPLVGAVVVKGNKILAKGYHLKAGLPHAEKMALKRPAEENRGASLYVNLEPCDHFGKTPPCTNEIIKSGIKEVIIGMRDPNPLNNGKGIYRLKRNGIKIKEGVLKEEAEDLNRPFTKFITKRLPYVTIKVAQSLDGKIATTSGDSKWISNLNSRRYAHYLRNTADAVLVGINTVLCDNPILSPRLQANPKQNLKKIVIDAQLEIPLKARLLKNPQSLIIATTKKSSKKKIDHLKSIGVELLITKTRNGWVDLKFLLKYLAKRNITHILVEGGGNVISSFLKEKLADELFFFISPKIIGGRNAVTSVEGKGIKLVQDAVPMGDIKMRHFGEDFLIHGKPIYRAKHVYRNNRRIRKSKRS